MLTADHMDRIDGVLLGQAVGDALGVPYELGSRPLEGSPRMLGGGLGDYAPGEFSDDTQMAVVIAQVSATGADLTSDDALDEIAEGFVAWLVDGVATDVGNQTRAVLTAVAGERGRPGLAGRMRQAAREYYERTGRAAGNGALMRGGVVGLTRLNDPEATAAAARAVAELTHADLLAAESCVLHADMVRRHVLAEPWDSHPGGMPRVNLDLLPEGRRDYWRQAFEGPCSPGKYLNPPRDDGFTADALGKALLALAFADRFDADPPPATSRSEIAARWASLVLERAISTAHDTDTVAAIAGPLVGSRVGAAALRPEWVERVHGKAPGTPGVLRAADLRRLARETAQRGAG